MAAPAGAAITASATTDPSTGFPASYTDGGATALTICQDGSGFCFVVTPAPNPGGGLPNSFTPDGEAFYYDADATMPNAGTGVIRFAQEVSFVDGNVSAGNQAVFNRVRYRFQTLEPNAWYRMSGPWSIDEIQADGSGIINSTIDVGCPVAGPAPPCDFAASTAGAVNQWLSAVSPAPPAGYIGNFAILQTITPGPTGLNSVTLEKITGPGGLVVGAPIGSVNQFNVSGKLAGAPPPPAAAMAINTAAMSFGNRQVGTTSPLQTVTVTNSGNATGTVSGVTVTGAEAADFVVSQNTCTAALAAGASCSMKVAFAPTASGDRAATLNIANTGLGGTRTIALTGTGLPATIVAPAPAPAPVVTPPAPAVTPPSIALVTPKLRLGNLFVLGRQKLRTVHQHGIRVTMNVPARTDLVSLAIYKAVNGQASGKAIGKAIRVVDSAPQKISTRMNDTRLRKALKLGRYMLVVTPVSTDGARGESARYAFQVVR